MNDAPPATPASDFAAEPDGFERLWTPHRMAYIDGEARPAGDGEQDCPFCLAPAKDDGLSLVVARGTTVYAVLNLYPYNPGHLLICPYRHIADLTEATEEEAVDLMAFARMAMRALRAASQPAGFNLGCNQGSVAGAGIRAHLHLHVVPRWAGDANFFPIIGRTRAMPQLLGDTRDQLAAAWEQEGAKAGVSATPRGEGRC